MAFLSSPGIEALYSGDETTNASVGLEPIAQRLRSSRKAVSFLDVGTGGRAIELRHRPGVNRPAVALNRFGRQTCETGVQRPLVERGGEDEEGDGLAHTVGRRDSYRTTLEAGRWRGSRRTRSHEGGRSKRFSKTRTFGHGRPPRSAGGCLSGPPSWLRSESTVLADLRRTVAVGGS